MLCAPHSDSSVAEPDNAYRSSPVGGLGLGRAGIKNVSDSCAGHRIADTGDSDVEASNSTDGCSADVMLLSKPCHNSHKTT